MVLGLLGLLALAGCGENRRGTILVPTGPRPLPDVLTGALTGRVLFDPLSTPDLATPPFPPTIVDLLSGGTVVRSDTLGGARDQFGFAALAPGNYRVAVRSRVFYPQTSAVYRVVDREQYTNDVVLLIDPSAISQTLGVVGTMSGYGPDFVFDNAMDLLALGLWTFPNLFATPPDIAAGTYRMKLATDVSIPGAFIGWGGGLDGGAVGAVRGPAGDVRERARGGPQDRLPDGRRVAVRAR